MAKEFWLNLPVKNLKKSKDFFTHMGFVFKEGPGNTPTMAPLVLGSKNIIVMLCEESTFQGFVNHPVSNTGQGCEVLLSFDAASPEEVDQLAAKAVEAGGTTNHKPHPMQGMMYGCIFTDLDGHRWNILHMNM